MLTTLGLLANWAIKAGSYIDVLLWYFAPYTVCNMWIVLYTLLHHTHEDNPHFGSAVAPEELETCNWLRCALGTIDRPYNSLLNHLHHNLGNSHMLHHLNSRIPFWNAPAATECLKKVLNDHGVGELYRYDGRGLFEAFISTSKECHYVESLEGVQFWTKKGKKMKEL